MVYERIYRIVKRIPKGKVATYGQIALMVNDQGSVINKKRINPRVVGWALHKNPDPNNIPCHRVVSRIGNLATGFAFGGIESQRRKLEEEGVLVHTCKVDLERFLWKVSE